MTTESFAPDDEVDPVEYLLGTPPELWLGPDDEETGEERRARIDAARDILAESPELHDRVRDLQRSAGRGSCAPVLLFPCFPNVGEVAA